MGELKRERMIEGIETVGALREAFSDLGLVDDVPLRGLGVPVILTQYRDMETGEMFVDIE